MSGAPKRQRVFTEINPAAVRAGMSERAWTAENLADWALIHRNTVSRILAAQGMASVDVETAKRIAIAFQAILPLKGIEAIAPPKASLNGAARVMYPIPIDPLVRQTLPDDAPVLVREREWYREVTPELQARWSHRVARLRSGNLARSRDFNFADVEVFLDELRGVREGSRSEVAVT
jgi:hypothetical protein